MNFYSWEIKPHNIFYLAVFEPFIKVILSISRFSAPHCKLLAGPFQLLLAFTDKSVITTHHRWRLSSSESIKIKDPILTSFSDYFLEMTQRTEEHPSPSNLLFPLHTLATMASIMDTIIHQAPAINTVLLKASNTDDWNLLGESESLPSVHPNPANLWGILLADSSNPSDVSESIIADDSKLSDFSESILTDDSKPSDLSGSVLSDDSSLSELSESLPTDDTCYSHSHTHLEALPAEIRFQILSLLEYKGLKALVEASSIYHEQYLVDCGLLLFGCLENTLGSLIFEASVVHETGSLAFSEARTSDNILQYCQSLKERRSSSKFSDLTADLTREDAKDMMAFHFDVIKPFAKHYAEWALSNLAKEPEASHTKVDEPLSESEEFRIIRALYRFQMCCNLFGFGPHKDHTIPRFQSHLPVKYRKIGRFLEDLYHPWELEELYSFNIFAEEKCTEIIKSIEWDFHEDNPKFDRQGRPWTPDGAIDIRSQYSPGSKTLMP